MSSTAAAQLGAARRPLAALSAGGAAAHPWLGAVGHHHLHALPRLRGERHDVARLRVRRHHHLEGIRLGASGRARGPALRRAALPPRALRLLELGALLACRGARAVGRKKPGGANGAQGGALTRGCEAPDAAPAPSDPLSASASRMPLIGGPSSTTVAVSPSSSASVLAYASKTAWKFACNCATLSLSSPRERTQA